jgi:hypothetical protein
VAIAAFLFVGGVSIMGCSSGRKAFVSDEVISSRGYVAPVKNGFAYGIVKVDGMPVVREHMIPFRDMWPRAVVDPGKHEFTVTVSPILTPPNYVPHTEVFVGTVEMQKSYMVVDIGGRPGLIEAHVEN